MYKTLAIAAVLLCFAVPAAADDTFRCESKDGAYHECRVTAGGAILFTRQMSDAKCIEGKSWGIRNGVVWVDSGCRAEFALVPLNDGRDRVGTPVVCESDDGERKVCPVDTGNGVAVSRQLSRSSCVAGETWGYDANSIWVTNGCRAEFLVGVTPRRALMIETLDQAVLCESHDGKMTRCAADTGAGVQIVRQTSRSACSFGRDWGYDDNGIWVSNGCRAEFAVRSPLQAAMVRCESQNERRADCRAQTAFGVSLYRQLSDAPCVLGDSWGYDENGVWVRNGCRGEFITGSRTLPASMLSSSQPTITCSSKNGRREHCRVDTSGGMILVRQLSDSDCQLNRTWGYDANGIWVTDGCRGEFAAGGFAPPLNARARSGSVICESIDGKRNVCPVDTSMGVAVVKQLSDTPCKLNSTWGYDAHGIWVTAGCRAEFILRK